MPWEGAAAAAPGNAEIVDWNDLVTKGIAIDCPDFLDPLVFNLGMGGAGSSAPDRMSLNRLITALLH
jgi:hypothetical protein